MPGKQVEIDESEYVALQQVAGLMQNMLNNKDARPLIQRATKAVAPHASIPEIDATAPIHDDIAKLREELAAERKAREDDKAKAEADVKLNAFKSKWEQDKRAARDEGYLDDAIKDIEKLAEERGIPDFEAAAAVYAKTHPVPQPVTPGGMTNFSLFEPQPEADESMKKLMDGRGDDPGALNSMINKALADVRGGNRRAA